MVLLINIATLSIILIVSWIKKTSAGESISWASDHLEIEKGREGCETSKRESGICKNIKKCPSMMDILLKAKENKEFADYLKGSLCGYDGKVPIVCCPGNKKTDKQLLQDEEAISSLPLPPYCGISKVNEEGSRIVGGKPAKLGSWPWAVALGYKKNKFMSGAVRYLCGGSLITNTFVLTAAHCNKQSNLLTITVVRLGDLNLDNSVDDGANPIDVPVEDFIKHEDYSTERLSDDIALVKLQHEVTFTDLIQPICLPIAKEMRTNEFINYQPFVAGWGSVGYRKAASDALMELQLPILPLETCQQAFNTHGVHLTERQICAGYLSGGKDSCQGDSGGSLMLPQGHVTYAVGVVSYGFKCATQGYPGIYTKVASYIAWIANKIKNNS